MSRENVEIVRRVYAAAAGRDAAAVLEGYDPGVEWDTSRVHGSVLGGRVYRGHSGLRSFFREMRDGLETLDYDFDELIDAGDQVISVVTVRGRGRASGIEMEWPRVAVWTIRAGKVVRVVWFPTREEALEAVGLRG